MMIPTNLAGVVNPRFLVVMLARTIAAGSLQLRQYDPIEDLRLAMKAGKQKQKFEGIADLLFSGAGLADMKDKTLVPAISNLMVYLLQWSPSAGDYVRRNKLTPKDLQDEDHSKAMLTGMAMDLKDVLSGDRSAPTDDLLKNPVSQLLQRENLVKVVFPELSDPELMAQAMEPIVDEGNLLL